jgi:hypothetical protein
MRSNRFWKRALRRDLPIIAVGAVVAGATVLRTDGSLFGHDFGAHREIGYLGEIAPPAEPTRAFQLTAVGTAPVAGPKPALAVTPSTKPKYSLMPDLDHRFVTTWVARFTGQRKHDLQTTLDRMEPYVPMIEKKLAERGMPKELVYLALIESGGNPRATSPVKAKGLWQFMAPTAKQYGLKVAGRVDERVNPEKATDAALSYLSDLHDRFGSWYLAAAAYNVGQGRIAKTMKQVTGKPKGTDADFYRIASRLPKETRDYVPKLVAVARIAESPAKYGIAE